MSLVDGPMHATNSSGPEASTSAYTWTITTKGDTLRVMTDRTPSGPTDTGLKGELCWDKDWLYICVDDNGWKRVAISDSSW